MKVRTKQHSSVVISSYWEPVANILLHLYFFAVLREVKFSCVDSTTRCIYICAAACEILKNLQWVLQMLVPLC